MRGQTLQTRTARGKGANVEVTVDVVCSNGLVSLVKRLVFNNNRWGAVWRVAHCARSANIEGKVRNTVKSFCCLRSIKRGRKCMGAVCRPDERPL